MTDDAVHTAEAGEGPLAAPSPALLVEGVSKTFPGVKAVVDVSLEVRPGEIRGLVGENGSGKSTLMRVLAGDLVPDEGGRVTIDENPLPFGSPIVAQRLGVGLIPQELMIVEALSALENVFMGDYPKRGPWVAWRRMSQEFARLCESLDVSLDPHAVASDLSVADLTMVEIMRATRREAKVLLMDEPTAALGRSEREKLYALVRRLAGHGRTVIFISHDLDEVLALTDVITVLRDGRHVATQPASAWTKRALVERMVGDASVALGFEKALAEARPKAAPTAVPAAQAPDQDVVLSAGNVTVPGKLAGVSFDVRRGEILGIAGLVGSGRSTLLRALAGLLRQSDGELHIAGKPVTWPRSSRQALRLGIALVPEERRREGLVLGMPAYDNVTITDLQKVANLGMLRKTRSMNGSEQPLEQVGYGGQPGTVAGTLSGGNQQKVLLAKWLYAPPLVFLIDEPTRGIDVRAKQEVLTAIRQLADAGNAVVFVSSEFEEIVATSDRVLLMARDGSVRGDLTGDAISVDAILGEVFAVEKAGQQRDLAAGGAVGRDG